MRKGVQGPLARSGNTPVPAFIYRPPVNNGLTIIYRDDDILVLSKPANLLTVPGKSADLKDSLETRALAEFSNVRTVHRLDRGTSRD